MDGRSEGRTKFVNIANGDSVKTGVKSRDLQISGDTSRLTLDVNASPGFADLLGEAPLLDAGYAILRQFLLAPNGGEIDLRRRNGQFFVNVNIEKSAQPAAQHETKNRGLPRTTKNHRGLPRETKNRRCAYAAASNTSNFTELDPLLQAHIRLMHVKTRAPLRKCECEKCVEARGTRVPHNLQPVREPTRPGQVLHVDVGGAVKPAGLSGERFFLAIKCGFSKNPWCAPMRAKFDAPEAFKKGYKAKVHYTAERVRTDGAAELTHAGWNDAVAPAAATDATARASSPANGAAENLIRQLNDVARVNTNPRNRPLWP
jgi:hypothetical protein